MTKWNIGLAAVAAMMLAGCVRSFMTSDGIRVEKGESEASVRTKLGAPDLVEEHCLNLGSCILPDYEKTEGHYYLERGYIAEFENRRLCSVLAIDPKAGDELRRREQIVRSVTADVPEGAAAREVIGRLGAPDLIETIEVIDGMTFVDVALYRPEKLSSGAVDLMYTERDASVRIEEGVCRRVRAMAKTEPDQVRRCVAGLREQERLAAEDPPRVGMTCEQVQQRWGRPPAVSGVVKGHEVLTMPGDDPAGRMKTEITAWYYPSLDRMVRLSDGRVAAIELMDGERKDTVQKFQRESIQIERRIGRTAEERLD